MDLATLSLIIGIVTLTLGLGLTFLARWLLLRSFWLFILAEVFALIILGFSFLAFSELLMPDYVANHFKFVRYMSFFSALVLSLVIVGPRFVKSLKEKGEDSEDTDTGEEE